MNGNGDELLQFSCSILCSSITTPLGVQAGKLGMGETKKAGEMPERSRFQWKPLQTPKQRPEGELSVDS